MGALTKTPMVLTKTPVVLTKAPVVLTKTPVVLTKTPVGSDRSGRVGQAGSGRVGSGRSGRVGSGRSTIYWYFMRNASDDDKKECLRLKSKGRMAQQSFRQDWQKTSIKAGTLSLDV